MAASGDAEASKAAGADSSADALLAAQLEAEINNEGLNGVTGVELIEDELRLCQELGQSLEDAAAELEDNVVVQGLKGKGTTMPMQQQLRHFLKMYRPTLAQTPQHWPTFTQNMQS
jgi:hypothetical protein